MKKAKRMKKNKRIINLYNIAILLCILIILLAAYIIFVPNDVDKLIVSGVEIVQTNKKENEEITEEEAKKLAVKQFEKLGENTSVEKVKVVKIRRDLVQYYYITSAKNTVEIRIKDGKIERINSVLIEE